MSDSGGGQVVKGRLSAIVPTKDSARTLEACLGSIRAQTHSDMELIVVDNASSDATQDIARRHADLLLEIGPERSTQRNAGANRSSGEFLLFVDSDMVLPPGAAEQVVHEFTHDSSLDALVIPERSEGVGYWARCRALEKKLYVGDAEIEAARAFRRWSFASIGGFNEVIQAGGEDWELSERLRSNGSHVGRIKAYIVHDEGKLSLREDLRKKFHYGAGLRRYARLAPRRALRKITRRAFARLVRVVPEDPLHASGLMVMKALELCAVVAGMAASMCRTLLRRRMR